MVAAMIRLRALHRKAPVVRAYRYRIHLLDEGRVFQVLARSNKEALARCKIADDTRAGSLYVGRMIG